MEHRPEIAILGGGPAGLAVGYFARERNLSFTIYEAAGRTGGNAITFEHDGFRYDSGAHRFHDKDPQVTAEIERLLGDELVRVAAPSRIYHRGRYVDFPLSPLDLFMALGPRASIAAAVSLLRGRLERRSGDASFRDLAIGRYGEDLARRFLLGYSEKLWGLPAEQLSPAVAGRRLAGLTLRTLIHEFVAGKRAKTEHLDGAFLYPRGGYGRIVERLAERCGPERIRTDSPVTALHHDGRRIVAVEIGRRETVRPAAVVSTIPIAALVRALDPAPRPSLLRLASNLRSRNLLLVAFFLDRERLTPNASVYFPDREFPMTRAYEPRNRSPQLAPPGRTSVVVEIPCGPADELWSRPDSAIVDHVRPHLQRIGWVDRTTLLGTRVHRLPHAYPVLELGVERQMAELTAALECFENLHLVGRVGLHAYTHVHDMLRFGIDTAARLARAHDDFGQHGRAAPECAA